MLFRPQVQPWHPSSTLAHEAGLAVLRRAPERFWAFSAALMGAQRVYFDEAVARETRNQTYRRLARLAAESTGLDEDGYYALLAVAEDGEGARNGGNAVTADLKVVVKMARLVGVHVSPTVVLDGVVAEEVSSGWSGEQWMEWLEKKIG